MCPNERSPARIARTKGQQRAAGKRRLGYLDSATNEALGFYHDLLIDDRVASTVRILERGVERDLVNYETPGYTQILRPYLIHEDHYAAMLDAAEKIAAGLQIVATKLLKDDFLFALLELRREELIGATLDSRPLPGLVERLDGLVDDNGILHFIELNDTPGGIASGDRLEEIFASMPVMKAFGEKYAVRSVRRSPLLRNAIFEAAKHERHSTTPPSCLFFRPLIPESNHMAQSLRRLGIRVHIARDEQQPQYRPTGVFLNGKRIDFLATGHLELVPVARSNPDHPLIRAIRDHRVRLLGGAASSIVRTSRIAFAHLSDEKNRSWFSKDIANAIARHIPWTRQVRDAQTSYHGRPIDLLEFILTNRTNLVMKACGTSGGKGVLLGWNTNEKAWRNALGRALTGDHVVQERVHGPKQTFAMVDARRRVTMRSLYVDMNPYVWHGRPAGLMVRASPSEVTNVSFVGSDLPVFVFSERE
jgi:diaminobutyrate-2-oxoglutarate transaminase